METLSLELLRKSGRLLHKFVDSYYNDRDTEIPFTLVIDAEDLLDEIEKSMLVNLKRADDV